MLARYKGSYFGILWSFVVPLIMLAVYGFVFSVVFQAKWGIHDESRLDFALTLFCGLLRIQHLRRGRRPGPHARDRQPRVRRRRWSSRWRSCRSPPSGRALFNAAIWLIILIPAWALANHIVSPTLWMLPIALFPLCLLSVGLAWFISSLGACSSGTSPTPSGS